jgi:hypothetical protein
MNEYFEWKTTNTKEVGAETGDIADAIVVRVLEGKIKTFIPEGRIQGDPEKFCINVESNGKDKDGVRFRVCETFAIQGITEDGKIAYHKRSKLAQVKKVNGCLPDKDKIMKCFVNSDGLWKYVKE